MQSSKKKKQKLDAIYYGIIPGMVAPALGFYLVFLAKNQLQLTFWEFVKYLSTYDTIPQALTLGVLANLLVFFIFIWTKKYESARGVIIATIIYTVLILGYKYLIN